MPDRESSPQFRPLTAAGLVWAAPLVIVFLGETKLIKLLELRAVEGGLDLVRFAQVWSSDLAFACAVLAVAALLFSVTRGWLRGLLFAVYVLFMTYVLVFTAASHGYFQATGETISWSSIKVLIINFSDTTRVVASEGGGGRLVFVAAQLVLVAFAAVLPHLSFVRRRTSTAAWPGRETGATCLGIAAALAVGLTRVPPAPGQTVTLSRCVAADILADFVRDEILPETEVEIRDDERLDSSLVVERDASVPKLNVVFIIFESLNWKLSDVYTPGIGTTPFLAGLARESRVVDTHYSVVPHTTKALPPILCGIYPYLDTEAKETTAGILPRRCLAHILRSQGYATAFFQPAASFEKRDQLVANLGFDVYRGLDDLPKEGFEETNYFGREERVMLAPSLDWVDAQRGRPFFLTYLTLSTHHNYVTPQSYPYTDYPVEDVDQRNFMNAARYIDDFVRDVFSELGRRNLVDNTLFIIVGDHGEAFGEHGRRQHDMVMWEEGLHSFAMLYSPKLLPGPGRISGTRSHLDLLPTVCDALGITAKEGDFLGTSLLKPVPDDRMLFFSCWYQRRCLAMRQGPIKTIFHYELKPMEVYDNSADPLDLRNLAFSPGFDAAFLDARQAEMERWAAVVNQQYDEWEKHLADGVVSEQEPRAAQRLHASFDGLIELVGWEADPPAVEAGQDVRVKYVFRGLGRLKKGQKLFVHLVHRNGTVNADHVPGRGSMPLEDWEQGRYITDEHTIHIPGSWSTGPARLMIGFWDSKSGKRFGISDTPAAIDQQRLVVTEISVSGQKPRTAVTVDERRKRVAKWIGFEEPAMQNRFAATFGNRVALVAANLGRMDVHLAGTVEMTYLFKALAAVPKDWKLTVKLIRDDRVEIDGDHVPIGGLYPLSDWRTGEHVQDLHRIHIDMHLCKPGTYGAWLGFRSGKGPVPVAGDGLETDAQHRVRIGTVTIRPGEKPGQ